MVAKADAAIREAVGLGQRVSHPSEQAATVRRRKVVAAYGDVRDDLSKGPETTQRKLADKLAQFLESMPPFDLEAHKLARQAERFLNAERHRSESVARVSAKEGSVHRGADAPEEKTR